MKNLFFSLIAFFVLVSQTQAQKYHFEPVVEIPASSVKNQGKTGTCWSFSTSSFLESEIKRTSGKVIDISEMYNVRVTYPKKAWNYVMRQGTAQFSEGALAHDVMNALRTDGLVPQQAFTGLFGDQKMYDHSVVVPKIKKVLDKYIQKDSAITEWKQHTKAILDQYIGNKLTSFTFEGKTYTPESFLKMTGINPDDYITLTSFTHRPFYSSFILSIPDNFSNGSFYNLPLDEYMAVIDHALEHGFTISLDTDSSEPTFSQKAGVAVIPENPAENKKALNEIVKEKSITPEYRQHEFENFNTTDDHLMHITGIYKDQNGTKYYKVKNSWGTKTANGGYIFISESFMRLKSISVMIHKDALPHHLKKKLKL